MAEEKQQLGRQMLSPPGLKPWLCWGHLCPALPNLEDQPMPYWLGIGEECDECGATED